MKFKNSVIVCLPFLLCVGCGFSPLYKAPTQQEGSQEYTVQIKGPETLAPLYYKLRREMEVLMPTLAKKVDQSVALTIHIQQDFGDIALNERAKVMRSQGRTTAQVTVRWVDDQSGEHKKEFVEESVTSFTAQDVEEFSIMSAEQGSKDRMIIDLAQKITLSLSHILNEETAKLHHSSS